MKGIIAGVIAGILGALVWALVVVLTGMEIGYLAWGIGILVGIAVAWGTEGGQKNGIIAVVIVVLAILAGKYASVEIMISKEVKLANARIKQSMQEDDELLISWLADEIVFKIESNGGKVTWPKGVTADTADKKEDYPSEIWFSAKTAWAAMTDEEKAKFKSDVEAQIKISMDDFVNQVRGEGFLASFGVIDIIFFFLAISTAFKIASRQNTQPVTDNTASVQTNISDIRPDIADDQDNISVLEKQDV